MREDLGQLAEIRDTFTGVFVRFGSKKYGSILTICLKDIRDKNNKVISDHCWFNYTKGFSEWCLKEGDLIQFNARVKKYVKGYKGKKADINKPIQEDYKLNFPTQISILCG